MKRQGFGPAQPGDLHASADELALFVIDALEPAVRRRFERHLQGCVACAEALAREAAAEQTLLALWPEIERPLAPVLALPTRAPAPATSPAPTSPAMLATAAPLVPAIVSPRSETRASEQARPARPTAAVAMPRRSAAARGSSWNGLAAAAMTLLFLGYWTDVARTGRPGAVDGLAALDGLLSSEALCAAGGDSDAALCAGDFASSSHLAATTADHGENLTSATTPSRWACLSSASDENTCAPRDGARGFASLAPLCQEPAAGFCAGPRQP